MIIAPSLANPSSAQALPPVQAGWREIGTTIDPGFGRARLVLTDRDDHVGSWATFADALAGSKLFTRGYDIPAVAIVEEAMRFVAKPLNVEWIDDTDPLSGPRGGTYRNDQFTWLYDGTAQPRVQFAPGSGVRAIVDGSALLTA